ncbi:mCG145042, partial [Mus musculus]
NRPHIPQPRRLFPLGYMLPCGTTSYILWPKRRGEPRDIPQLSRLRKGSSLSLFPLTVWTEELAVEQSKEPKDQEEIRPSIKSFLMNTTPRKKDAFQDHWGLQGPALGETARPPWI